MNPRHCARLAGALFLCAIPALPALAQTPSEPVASRVDVAAARTTAGTGSSLIDGAPCVGDDDFHRFDGSPVPATGLPEAAPVMRVVLADKEPARARARRLPDRTRAAR